MNIEIYPLKKILIDHVAICFGMEKSSVDAAIGSGQLIGNRYYYLNNEMAIDYNAEIFYFLMLSIKISELIECGIIRHQIPIQITVFFL